MPLRLLKDRNRSGIARLDADPRGRHVRDVLLPDAFVQLILGYSPVETGFAYLPFSIGMAAAAGVSSKLVSHMAPRLIAGPGLLVAAAGMFWFATLKADSSYAGHLLPAMLVTGIGLGMSFVPLTLGAVSGVDHQDTGMASALLNTAQQIGGALGLAVLSTISTSAADDKLPQAASAPSTGVWPSRTSPWWPRAGEALTHGYTMAFVAAGVVFLAGVAVMFTAVNAGKQHPPRVRHPSTWADLTEGEPLQMGPHVLRVCGPVGRADSRHGHDDVRRQASHHDARRRTEKGQTP